MTEYIAKTLFGLEEVLAGELQALGASDVKPYNRAVGFTGDKRMLYRANYCLRTALKILVPLGETDIKDEDELYHYIRTIRWDNYLDARDTLAVDVAMKTSVFRHSQYIAQKVKDAVVDQFRDKYGMRPSVDLDRPTLRINVYISERNLKISRDSSGDSLHRRGYRMKLGPAPMNEVLAAGLIRLSGWNCRDPLVDFMCGSGTIAIEAALQASGIPPGDLRKDYGFQRWKDYDPRLFNEIANQSRSSKDIQDIRVYASDIDQENIKLAMRHAQNAGISRLIDFRTGNFSDLTPPPAPGVIIINPPYGERMVQQNLNDLYKQVGDRLKSAYTGYDAWIISANAEAMKHVGLRPSRKITVFNGQLECRFNRYSLYEGSKRAGKTADS